MSDIWFISDCHWNHSNILNFTNQDGTPVRSFSSVEEMNETMIDNWNSVVKNGDKVYNLGDVFFGKARDYFEKIHPRLNGKQTLIIGNHDKWIENNYSEWFKSLYLVKHFKTFGFIASHMPLHNSALSDIDRYGFNVHGHIHAHPDIDNAHLNISVERIGYKPIHVDEIVDIKRSREF